MNYIKTYTPIEEKHYIEKYGSGYIISKESEDLLQKKHVQPIKTGSDLYPLQIGKEYLRIINEQKQKHHQQL